MTQEKMDQMMEHNIIQLNLKENKYSITMYNPIFEISKYPFDEAKELMWKTYHHKLTEDEYALMPTADSPVDFFKKAAGLDATSGICIQCGCKWDSPCINEIHGACWWVDEKETICSHCYYGWK